MGLVRRISVIMRMYAVWRESATTVRIIAFGLAREIIVIIRMYAVWRQAVPNIYSMTQVLLPFALLADVRYHKNICRMARERYGCA